MEHLVEGGIFGDPDLDFETLIKSVQTIALRADHTLAQLQATGLEISRRAPDQIRYRLYDDLGTVYKHRWGRGSLPISVNAAKGGPAVRYFEFTLHRILGERVMPQAIKDAVDKIRKRRVDLDSTSSFFSPAGGTRI